MADGSRFLDVSVSLEPGMATYPGNPEFEFQPVKRIAEGASSNVSRLVLGTHTGTHVDAPKHFFDTGAAVDALALDLLIGPAVVLAIDKPGGITRDDLSAAGLRSGDPRVPVRVLAPRRPAGAPHLRPEPYRPKVSLPWSERGPMLVPGNRSVRCIAVVSTGRGDHHARDSG